MLALLNIYGLDLNWLLNGEGEMFVEEGIGLLGEVTDYGELNEEIYELLWHFEHTQVVKLAVVGFFLEYMHENEELIKKDREKYREHLRRKEKQEEKQVQEIELLDE